MHSWGRLTQILFVALVALATAFPRIAVSQAPLRRALVIGNGNYEGDVRQAPVRSASSVASSLRLAGFDTLERTDLDKDELPSTIRAFGRSLSSASPALIYYCGHGFQIGNETYLVPVGITPASREELVAAATPLSLVAKVLINANSGPNVVVIDACRNNPWQGLADDRGLAKPQGFPPNTIVAYSTGPGRTAPDGIGDLTPYSYALARFLKEPGLTIENVLSGVRKAVAAATQGIETPWEEGSLKVPLVVRPARLISFRILKGDDEVLVLMDGNQVASWQSDGNKVKTIAVTSGEHPVIIRVFNQHTFRGGRSWDKPEGWNYGLNISDSLQGDLWQFEDGEDEPKRDGPHHGKMFTVAQLTLEYDLESDKIYARDVDTNIWKR